MPGKNKKTKKQLCCVRPPKSMSTQKSKISLRSKSKSTSTSGPDGYVSCDCVSPIGSTDIPEFYGKTYSKVISLPRIKRGGKIIGVFKCVVSFIINRDNTLTFMLSLKNYDIHSWAHHIIDPIVTELCKKERAQAPNSQHSTATNCTPNYPNVQVFQNATYMGTFNKYREVYRKDMEIKIEGLKFNMNKINGDEYRIEFIKGDKTLLNTVLKKVGACLPEKGEIDKSISYIDYWTINDYIGEKTSGLHMDNLYPKYNKKNSRIELKIDDTTIGKKYMEFDMDHYEGVGTRKMKKKKKNKKIKTKNK